MHRWMLIGWAVLGLIGKLGAQQQDTLGPRDYTCDDVRQGQGGRKTETNPYIPFDSLAINSRQKALDFVQEVQRRAHLRALETGAERSVPVMWAIRKVKKFLSCQDILRIIIADIQFYDQYPELLPQGTYPWSLGGLPCARDWLKVDRWEESGPHYVGNAKVVFDSTRRFEHTFYGVYPYPYEGSEGLWVALHECLWQEGSADSLDWSWGEYAKQMDAHLAPVPTPQDFQIVHPVGNSGRRWIYDPSALLCKQKDAIRTRFRSP